MTLAEDQVRTDRERRLRAFIAKLRADLIFLGADPYVVRGMTYAQLVESRQRRIRHLMETPPRSPRWDG